jgi:hypothetical protein
MGCHIYLTEFYTFITASHFIHIVSLMLQLQVLIQADTVLFYHCPSLNFQIFTTVLSSVPALGLTQPPIQWVPGALSLGGKVAGASS